MGRAGATAGALDRCGGHGDKRRVVSRRPARPVRRSARALAVAAALALHAGLGASWLLQRTEPPAPPTPTFDVSLALPLPPPEPPRREAEPEREDDEPSAVPAVARAAAPRPSLAPMTEGLVAATEPAVGAPSPGQPAPVSMEAEPAGEALRGALAARLNCRDLDRLSAAERERCTQRVMAAPEREIRGTIYARVQEHAAIMADVRRRENTGYRASCEYSRNLDSTCPNALPNNLARDFERPRE